jgi:hypothetical protein
VAFSPDEAARLAVKAIAARWSAAMGCDVHVAPDGIPVVATPRLFVTYDDEGNPTTYASNAPGRRQICGLSTWNAARTDVEQIRIALENGACSAEYAAAHEMGHALVRARGHTLTGVLAGGSSPGKSDRIDEASLAAVCSMRVCGAFAPEG